MGEVIPRNNDSQEKSLDELLQMTNHTCLRSILDVLEVGAVNYTRLPISRLAALGTAFQPLVTAVQTTVAGAA